MGALAVGLGIGVAIASSPGVAFAAPSDGGGSSSSGSSSGSHGKGDAGKSDANNTNKPKPGDGAKRPDAVNSGKKSRREGKAESAKPSQNSQSAAQGASDADKSSTPDAPKRPAKGTSRPVVAAAEKPQKTEAAAPEATPAPQVKQVTHVTVPVSILGAPAAAVRAVSHAVPVIGPNGAANTSGGPVAPLQNAATAALLGATRRETAESSSTTSLAAAPTSLQSVFTVLGTSQQLAAEKNANSIVNTLPMLFMKTILNWAFQMNAKLQYSQVGGPDPLNLKQLGQAVNEYAQQAAMEYQLLNSMQPTVLEMVMPPHNWFGQNVTGTRILYDNPDTIYRMMAVNSTSSYVITGKFGPGDRPAETTFSVLTGLGGTTAAVLNAKDMQINPDGTFTITVSGAPAAPGQTNHLQIPTNTTLIVARNTLSDWNTQDPMSLSIERVGGPPNSLFAQIGGFSIPGLGPLVSGNQFLTNVVSLVPPLPVMPRFLQGLEASVILALGLKMEPQYMDVATKDSSGKTKPPNVFTDPESNATFLSTQVQSAGYFQLANDQALVLTIKPGDAGYFVVPVTNDWTITNNYWDQQTSLNIAQSIANPDGSYTIVVSPTDPGIANWVSTGGLNQGTISIRFQDIDISGTNMPKVSSQVVSLSDLDSILPSGTTYVTAAQRQAALDERKAGYDKRFAPNPQV
ncbi:DUF1214 domain-containing protein [Mycobacterium sp. CBMA293]|nr:DUF1214 domain-containing protein [Mycolicibacterium sp. CBMA 360]MUL62785.1 DUF1214 domain-containing protein [Mycolicibacterium sp. CBMA 335]MUL71986.1 DUF1214 domain-containing protein [Mycolicibacterium sp. CBMA 311]MUL97423.1 DUF1214 domain-containing protein [Mycolicibacterium sp. CBMA 230]MUM04769.1 hypothetical protein [Mycolicibacterium sp. CBMA 213]MUM15279.1 DUF1214 domain-containing protein [Mycolicibacterium sp. CBMA 293]